MRNIRDFQKEHYWHISEADIEWTSDGKTCVIAGTETHTRFHLPPPLPFRSNAFFYHNTIVNAKTKQIKEIDWYLHPMNPLYESEIFQSVHMIPPCSYTWEFKYGVFYEFKNEMSKRIEMHSKDVWRNAYVWCNFGALQALMEVHRGSRPFGWSWLNGMTFDQIVQFVKLERNDPIALLQPRLWRKHPPARPEPVYATFALQDFELEYIQKRAKELYNAI
jgi:hypothetical protein